MEGAVLTWLACAPAALSIDSDEDGPSAITREATCHDDRPPDRLEDAVPYWLRGSETLGDYNIGWKTSVGDLDGDGLDDIAVNGKSSPYVYLLRGATLVTHPPGDYVLADIADYRFAIEPGGGYGGWDIAVRIRPGHLYVSAPVGDRTPMAFRIAWDSLAGLEGVEHSLNDVASVRFTAAEAVGTWIGACDVNGDGEEDLILGSRYLMLGPFDDRDIDVDARSVLVQYLEDDWFCGDRRSDSGLRQCGDFNHDGFDDLLYSCGGVYVFEGGEEVGKQAVDLASPDVRLETVHDEDLAEAYTIGNESIGDWNGDGNDDMLVARSWASWSDREAYGNEAYLFLGQDGFFDRGTTLTRDGGVLLVSTRDPYFGMGGQGSSLRGDLNGDGYRDLVLGDPDLGLGGDGHVYVRYCEPSGEAEDLESFGETRYDGPASAHFADMGSSVATGDIDGNDHDDLVLAAPSFGPGSLAVILR